MEPRLCSEKIASFWGQSSRTSCRRFAPGLRWGTSVWQTQSQTTDPSCCRTLVSVGRVVAAHRRDQHPDVTVHIQATARYVRILYSQKCCGTVNHRTKIQCPHLLRRTAIKRSECWFALLWSPCGIGQTIIMVALCNRADHYFLWSPYGIGQTIIFSSCFFLLSSSFLFPRLISAVGDWMSTILPHMMWPSCEFRMQVWSVLHVARWKYRTQKWCKKIAIWAPLRKFVQLYLRN